MAQGCLTTSLTFQRLAERFSRRPGFSTRVSGSGRIEIGAPGAAIELSPCMRELVLRTDDADGPQERHYPVPSYRSAYTMAERYATDLMLHICRRA